MSDIIKRARLVFDQGIKFNMNPGVITPDQSLPEDKDGDVNCLFYATWCGGINPETIPYPRIDWIYDNYKRRTNPDVGDFICYPSRGEGSTFVPGCIAIISEMKSYYPSKIILAHPQVSDVIGEVDFVESRIFANKPFRYIVVP